MNWFHNLLVTVFDYFGRYRIINDRIDQEPYLERYYLFLKEREDFPFNIFLHRFINHPWSFRSIILKGGYWEYTKQGKFWRGPLSYRYNPADTFHRVELDKNIPYCWTLFIPGKRVKDWGFDTEKGWVQHEQYLVEKKKNI